MKKMFFSAIVIFAALGCHQPKAGHTWVDKDSPIITIKAGGTYFDGYFYTVDTKTHLCFWTYKIGSSSGRGGSSVPIPCCNLKRVPEAAKYVTWSTTGCSPVPASAPPPPANGAPPRE
ncbi:hypothetical protein KKF84_14775 [Myxococcota bacterium]|nr:hypothetical protein [Myxococcota bacterium]